MDDLARVETEYILVEGRRERYELAPTDTPRDWMLLLVAATTDRDVLNWDIADLIVDGERFIGVPGIDTETGEPCWDEDAIFDDANPRYAGFDYFDTLAKLEVHVPRSEQARLSAAGKKFLRDPESEWYRYRPEWQGAKMAHFIALRYQDLPWELVNRCLSGGYSVAACNRERSQWYEQTSPATVAEEEVEEEKPADKEEVFVGLNYHQTRGRHVDSIASWLVQNVDSLTRVTSFSCAEAVVWWIYHAAPKSVLNGALVNEEFVPWPPEEEDYE